jgi:Xaa-Pro aminopeptidase
VGLEVHELPVLNPRNDNPLVAGNVVTVEPGIYLPGQFGMRLEDCGVIEADGYKPFSELDHEMVVI